MTNALAYFITETIVCDFAYKEGLSKLKCSTNQTLKEIDYVNCSRNHNSKVFVTIITKFKQMYE